MGSPTPRTASAGAAVRQQSILALIASVGLRTAALAAMASPLDAGLALIAAHVVSRAALPALMRTMQPARADGLAATAGRPSFPSALVAAIFGIAIGLIFLGPPRGAAALILTGTALATMAVLARRQIGGYTGDVLGAFEQIGEIAMLLIAAAK